jgi:acyl transferase domain-containing protein
LRELAQRYEEFLTAHPEVSLADVCFTANTKRVHFDYRLCVVTESIAQLRQQLNAYITHKEADRLVIGKVKGRKRPKIAFFFPGEESATFSMGREFYETQPTFRQAFDLCADFLQAYLDKPLKPEVVEANSQLVKPYLFALEYALAQLWLSWGIKPKAVMGYGVGEYVAATIAGVLSLEDALRLVGERTRLMQTSQSHEQMVEAFAEIAKEVIYSQPQISLIPSLSKEQTTKEINTPEYWCSHLQQPEKFTSNLESLAGYQVVVAASKPNSLPQEIELCLSSLGQAQNDWQEILHSLGELFVRGAAIDWLGFDKDYSRCHLQLPTYPFQRQPYWFKTPENGHQEATLAHNKLETNFTNLLHHVENQEITHVLKEKGNFSEAQIKLLLEILTQQYQQQTNEKTLTIY